MQKIIRNESTLDRPEFRVSTEQVIEVARLFDQPFTSWDIAMVLAQKHRGVSSSRLERSVRACLSWLAVREIVYITGDFFCKETNSQPFLYAIHNDKIWNEDRKYAETKEFDYETLSRAFVYR